MRAALRAEWRKVLTVRMWWVLGLVLFGYVVFIGVVLGFSLTADPASMNSGTAAAPLSPEAIGLTLATLGVSTGYVFPLVVGALAMTGEFRHRTVTATFLAEPRRGVVITAKVLVAALLGGLYGLVGGLSGLLGGAPALIAHGDGSVLVGGPVLQAVLFSIVAMALWAAIGVGVGAVLTNQVAAVVVILAFTQFVEPVLRIALGSVDAVAGAQRFLPGAAAEALAGSSLYSTTGMLELLPRAAGALVLAGYAAVFAALAATTTLRRDVS